MGDMFICRSVIKKNAKIYNKDFFVRTTIYCNSWSFAFNRLFT